MIKNKLKKNLFFSIIGLLLIVLFIYTIYTFLNSKSIVNQEIINNLYNYLGSNDLSLCDGLYLYDKIKISNNDVLDSQKLCNAYLNLDKNLIIKTTLAKKKNKNYCDMQKLKFATDEYKEDICTISTIKKEDLLAEVKKIYNTEVGEFKDFKIDDNQICKYYNENYYCGLAENFVYSLQKVPHIYRSIYKTVEKENTIEIYDYFLKTLDSKCYGNYVTDEDIPKCSQKIANIQDVSYAIMKKYATLYKHTFIKNNETGKYYWNSTTIVKEK